MSIKMKGIEKIRLIEEVVCGDRNLYSGWCPRIAKPTDANACHRPMNPKHSADNSRCFPAIRSETNMTERYDLKSECGKVPRNICLTFKFLLYARIVYRRAGMDFARRKVESLERAGTACTDAVRPQDIRWLNGQPRGMSVAEHYQTHSAMLPR